MRVMLVRTNKNPQIIDVAHRLQDFQRLLGGMIEVVEPFEDDVVIVCSETGRNEGKTVNRVINGSMDICGDFFLCGQKEDELTDFPMDLEYRYSSMFHLPN